MVYDAHVGGSVVAPNFGPQWHLIQAFDEGGEGGLGWPALFGNFRAPGLEEFRSRGVRAHVFGALNASGSV